jgi:hypothetical protein
MKTSPLFVELLCRVFNMGYNQAMSDALKNQSPKFVPVDQLDDENEDAVRDILNDFGEEKGASCAYVIQ